MTQGENCVHSQTVGGDWWNIKSSIAADRSLVSAERLAIDWREDRNHAEAAGDQVLSGVIRRVFFDCRRRLPAE